MKLIAVAGARPNFMRIAPLMWELGRRRGVATQPVHTGQHDDERMSRKVKPLRPRQRSGLPDGPLRQR